MVQRRLSVLFLLTILVGSLWVTPSRAQLPDLPLPDLPQLPLEEVLDAFNIAAPPEGVGLMVFADFPVKAPYQIEDVLYSNLTLEVTNSGVETRKAVAAEEGGSGEAPGECADPTFGAVGRMWAAEDVPVVYKINQSSFPPSLDAAKTIDSIKLAHQAWAETNSRCEEGDPIEFSFSYGGTTDATAIYDDMSVIEFGPVDQAVAITYAWFVENRIVEADMRINNQYSYGNGRRTRKYNVRNLVTHETGHQLGLDDLDAEHAGLTMFGRVLKGEFFKTTLGQGDIKGAQALTP